MSATAAAVRACCWEYGKGDACGKYAPYDLGYPEDDPVHVCPLHASRASSLGWPIKRVAASYPLPCQIPQTKP